MNIEKYLLPFPKAIAKLTPINQLEVQNYTKACVKRAIGITPAQAQEIQRLGNAVAECVKYKSFDYELEIRRAQHALKSYLKSITQKEADHG